MHSIQKKIITLGFVLLLAIPLFFSVMIILEQKVVQLKRHTEFKTKKIETVSVLKQNMVWAKIGKEVIIDGKYFDVKSFNTNGDKVLLTGYYDHKEDKLVNQIKKIFQQKNEKESPINLTAVKYLFFPVFNNQSVITIPDFFNLSENRFYSSAEKIPVAPVPGITHPPQL